MRGGVLASALVCGLSCRATDPEPHAATSTAVAAGVTDAGDSSADAASEREAGTAVDAARTSGGLTGSIGPDRPRYVQAEPAFVRIEITNDRDEPLSFDDSRRHYDWQIRDAGGREVCRHRGGPARLGSEMIGKVRLARGETFRDTLLLNAFCAAPLPPGRYSVTVLRTLVAGWDPVSKRACERPGEGGGAPDDPGAQQAPCFAADFDVEIGAWDAAALRARAAGLDQERKAASRAKDLPLEGALAAYGDWFCDHVRCDCAPTWERYGEWFAKALARVPDALPRECKRR